MISQRWPWLWRWHHKLLDLLLPPNQTLGRVMRMMKMRLMVMMIMMLVVAPIHNCHTYL